jgi:ankyrin repeat protein
VLRSAVARSLPLLQRLSGACARPGSPDGVLRVSLGPLLAGRMPSRPHAAQDPDVHAEAAPWADPPLASVASAAAAVARAAAPDPGATIYTIHPSPVLVFRSHAAGHAPIPHAAALSNTEHRQDFDHQDVYSREWTPFLACAFHGHARGVADLLSANRNATHSHPRRLSPAYIDINASTSTGITALMMAAFHGHINVLVVLTSDPHIDLCRADASGMTAWLHAVSNFQVAVLEFLAEIRDKPAHWCDAAGIDFVRAIIAGDAARAISRFESLAGSMFAQQYYQVGLALGAKHGGMHIVYAIESMVSAKNAVGSPCAYRQHHGKKLCGRTLTSSSSHGKSYSHGCSEHSLDKSINAVPLVIAKKLWLRVPICE